MKRLAVATQEHSGESEAGLRWKIPKPSCRQQARSTAEGAPAVDLACWRLVGIPKCRNGLNVVSTPHPDR